MLQKNILKDHFLNFNGRSELLGQILLILIVLTPLVYSNKLAFGAQTGKLTWCGIVSIFSFAYLTTYLSKYKLHFKITDLLICFFIAYISIEHLLLNGNQHNNKLLIFILSFIFYLNVRFLVGNVLAPNRSFNTILLAIVLVNLCCLGYAIGQKAGVFQTFNTDFTITSTFFHPAVFSGYLALTTPFLFGLIAYSGLRKSITQKVLCSTTIIFNCCFLFVLDNRASIIGVSMGAIFVLFPKLINYIEVKKVSKLSCKLVKVSLISIFLLFVCILVMKRPDSAYGRILVWKIASPLFTNNFFFGIGIDKFKYAYPDRQIEYFKSGLATDEEINLSSEVSFAFNEIVQTLIEFGGFGFVIFIVVIWLTFKSFHFHERDQSRIWTLRLASLGGIVSLLIYSNFAYPFSTVELTVSFFFLLAVANSDIEQNDKVPGLDSSNILLILYVATLVLYSWRNIYTFTRQMSLLDRAEEHVQLGRTLEAERTFQFLLRDESMSRNVGFMSYYSRFLIASNKYKEAAGILKRKNDILSSYDDLIALGATYELLGDTSSAIEVYWNAYFLLPHKFKPVYHIMLLHENRKEHIKAKSLARYLVKKNVKVRSIDVLKMQSMAALILNRRPPGLLLKRPRARE